jgi:uncharacterized protein
MTVTKTPLGTGLFFLALILNGCATSRSPVYYMLTPKASMAISDEATAAVGIGPFLLPEYLDRPQMVTRTAGAAIKIEELHRWAGSLEDIFVRTLATDVSRWLGSDAVFEYPVPGNIDPPNRVSGNVQRFDVNEDGQAILEVQWTIADREGRVVHTGIRARYEAIAADAGNFAGRVDALSATVDEFGADIAVALRDRAKIGSHF